MGEVISKIFLCLFLGVILLFFGFVASAITSLTSGVVFYSYVIMAVDIGIIVLVSLMILGFVKKKRIIQLMCIYFAICIISGAVYFANRSYKNSIATINEQQIDLIKYMPFEKDTKAEKLPETSELKITSDIPKLDGATALYPLYSAFAQAVYPEDNYNIGISSVQCNTTEKAYDNLMSGQVDVIFAAKPSQQQIEDAKAKGIEFRLTSIGREAFVFFVNSNNSVSDLSTKQIQDIYSGKITNWNEVGGKDEKIRAFQRPQNSGSQTMLQKLMEGKTLMSPPREDVVSAMDGIIKKTSDYKNYKNAIGYSFLFYATEMVKSKEINLIKVNGIYPSKETIKSREYPLSAEFYAITAGSKNPNVEPFIKWILSRQGQYLVEKTGYTPINDTK
ncbi:substrate-binding domain-containing protein [Clostridium sp. YIM B02515]|uniref:Substrate-binding domain-containing protein n=1 Tax=Clostridium rhizosphaerae TaxID=2803861 RepID=A0ABS1TD08_9CLOT|nr:substrate-binding domain-containing protein [Clostridium rhizosphaerae]MBL4937246.1 substrate-binding domain-containing protein [Clostridium rhizosphaerae]